MIPCNKLCNKKIILALGLFLFCAAFISFSKRGVKMNNIEKVSRKEIKLTTAKHDSSISIEKTLCTRRSIREYNNKPIELAQLSQLLWAAQGITKVRDGYGLRTAPSAGALYPMELYIVVENVTNLPAGVYKYNCKTHSLKPIKSGKYLGQLATASLEQSCISNGAAAIIITGVFERTRVKYGSRGTRYVYMEAGHVAENIYLQGVSLGVGTVTVGAFSDKKVQKLIGAQENEQPLYVMPIGIN